MVRWAVGFNGLSVLCLGNWGTKESKSINGNDKAREKLIERQPTGRKISRKWGC